VIGLAAVISPIVGGALVDADVLGSGGRAIFLVNVPVGAAGLAGVLRVMPPHAGDRRVRLARQTGTRAVGTFRVQTDGTSPAAVASRVRRLVGPSAQVSDIESSRRVVGSNLTAVELTG
jgi:putative ABC transport system permease protein